MDGEIGGYERPGALELGAYYDVDALRQHWGPNTLTPISRFLCHHRAFFGGHEAAAAETTGESSNGTAGEPPPPPPPVLDALVVFAWSDAERAAAGLARRPPQPPSPPGAAVVECTDHFLRAGLATRAPHVLSLPPSLHPSLCLSVCGCLSVPLLSPLSDALG